MLRMRFPIALLAALAFGATAHAQSAPAAPVSARIEDIQIARDGETISILVKLSQQPAAATATPSGETLAIDIDGLKLVPLTLAPPPGSLVTRVQASADGLTLSGAAFGNVSTVIYRNAVMIEAKLAEPSLRTGSSLMASATLVKPEPIPSVAPARVAAPAPAALSVAKPAATPANDLQSHPGAAPLAQPKPAAAISTASLAGIDAARCTSAASELAKDAWALAAMGDHALCLLDTGKTDEAKNRLDQLAAITPQDWRVALGRAVLEEKSGDSVKAQASYVAASLAAPSDKIRANIAAKISPVASTDSVPLDLPKPTALAAH
jgi:hypothetical protein